MRLFYSLDGDSKLYEHNTAKLSFRANDVIVAETEEQMYELSGLFLMDGSAIAPKVVQIDNYLELLKEPGDIIFYAFYPKKVESLQQSEKVLVKVFR